MRDISYYPCIQIEGPVSEILSKLSAVSDGFCGRGEDDDDVLGGRVERKTFVYRSGKRPLGVVGEVSYLWRPSHPDENDGRGCLWVFCHPAFYDEIKKEIVSSVFCCERDQNGAAEREEEAPPPTKRRKKEVGAAKLATRNVPFERTPKYRSSTGAVTVTLLKDTINRFRLVGPESGTVLAAALRRTESEEGTKWWQSKRDTFSAQWDALEATLGKARPAEIKAGSVFAVTVRDPRVVLPKKRGTVKEDPRKPGRYI